MNIGGRRSSPRRRHSTWPPLALAGAAILGWIQPTGVVAQSPRSNLRVATRVQEDLPSPGDMVRLPDVAESPEQVAPEFVPWWQEEVSRQLRGAASPLEITLDSVVLGTLMHSPQVRILADSAQIQRTAIDQAVAAFDPRAYMQTNFIDTSDPVGSLLTTGGATRFLDQNWNYTAGVKQRTLTGAQVDLSQRLGYQDNNSIYFVPNPQGTAKMALSLTQPLLQGSGKGYNSSLIVLAELSANVAHDQMSKDLQDVLYKVHQAYWDVYLQRAVLLQKRKLHRQAIDILAELNSRRDVDVLGNQLVRARAAVAAREAATIRFSTEVQNAESKLRTVINDPNLLSKGGLELIPSQRPSLGCMNVNLVESLGAALSNRPEINQANREMRAAAVRADVSKNELLPVLNLILGTYVYGLHGNGDIGTAIGNQYSLGRPSWSTGLNFEIPWGNRAANARMRQRRLELRQAASQLQVTTANVRNEVEIAGREVTTTHQEMQSRSQAMLANDSEVQYLADRWRLLPGDQQVAGVVLHDLLNAQERLADAEMGYARSLVEYNVALINLKRCTGTLLQYEKIVETQSSEGGVPNLNLSKPTGPPNGAYQQPTPAQQPGASTGMQEARRPVRLPAAQ